LCKVFPHDKIHLELLDIESMCNKNLCVAVKASRSQSNDLIPKAQLNRNHLDICIGKCIQLCRVVIQQMWNVADRLPDQEGVPEMHFKLC
jgi:hypothetical protein